MRVRTEAAGRSSTEAHDAAERREAARALLVTPFVTASTAPQTLALIRRHSAALRAAFATQLGCALVVEASFARLVKAPVPDSAPSRPLRRGDSELAPRTYAYLSLLCAGLLSPDVGEQVLVSALIEQVRADAAAAGLEVGDSLAERRQLVAAVEVLVGWGVLTETDGTVGAWGERRDEALLTVHRPLLPHLLVQPLRESLRPEMQAAVEEERPGFPGDRHPDDPPEDAAEEAAQVAAESPRRSLRRRLVEDPLVRREDLSPGELDALSRDRRELARVLDETFGLVLEVRAEGALAYDPDGEVTDVVFPGPGTVRQAALLLLDAVVDRTRPEAGATAMVEGREVPGVLAPWELVDENLADLAERNAAAWSAAYVSDVARLRREVVALLASLSLARPTEDGLVVHPAAARYRPDPQRAVPTRSRRRAAAAEPTPAPEASLFDSLEGL